MAQKCGTSRYFWLPYNNVTETNADGNGKGYALRHYFTKANHSSILKDLFWPRGWERFGYR